METKFLHEHRNRQDKARKADYRENFYEESAIKDSPRHLERFKRMLAIGKERMDMEAERRNRILAYKEQVMLRYWQGEYHLAGHEFRFTWGFKDYVKHNQIEVQCNQTLKRHKLAAVHDFEAIMRAISDAQVSWGALQAGLPDLALRLSVNLQCERIVPARLPGDGIGARVLTKGAA